MSQQVLAEVLERASADSRFRAELTEAPERALAGYALTDDERLALIAGDRGRLHALGLDPRITKVCDGPEFPITGDPPII